MSPEKRIEFHGRPARKGVLLTPVRARRKSLPPLFLSLKLRRTIERLLPAGHHQRLRLYFDTYGCLRCLHNDVIYGGNGFFLRCLPMIYNRLNKSEKQPQARLSDPPPTPEEAFPLPFNPPLQLPSALLP